jgi:hypothetical protein
MCCYLLRESGPIADKGTDASARAPSASPGQAGSRNHNRWRSVRSSRDAASPRALAPAPTANAARCGVGRDKPHPHCCVEPKDMPCSVRQRESICPLIDTT